MGWNFGRCNFEGNSMGSSTMYAGIKIFYNGSIRKSGTSGNQNIWKGTGDICVVYEKQSAIGKHIFNVDGKVQECTKMAR